MLLYFIYNDKLTILSNFLCISLTLFVLSSPSSLFFSLSLYIYLSVSLYIYIMLHISSTKLPQLLLLLLWWCIVYWRPFLKAPMGSQKREKTCITTSVFVIFSTSPQMITSTMICIMCDYMQSWRFFDACTLPLLAFFESNSYFYYRLIDFFFTIPWHFFYYTMHSDISYLWCCYYWVWNSYIQRHMHPLFIR